MPVNLTFPYHPDRRTSFYDGTLVDKWYGDYGDMFDENDYRLARSQPGHHFFEWLAAVMLREATGYHSLVEKYDSANHPEKVEKFRQIVSPEVFEFAMNNRAGLPDLFAYKPESKNWFFCEVKGGPDRLSARQEEIHKKIEQLSSTPVYVLWLREL